MKQIMPAELSDFLAYDPDTGLITWKKLLKLTGSRPGDVAGYCTHIGYLRVRFRGAEYLSHRLAWFLHTGEQPPPIIDHADRDKTNNRWSNLRAATKSQNNANCRRVARPSPYGRGVGRSSSGRFIAKISSGGRHIHLGSFDTVEQAADAYAVAARHYHGEFASLA